MLVPYEGKCRDNGVTLVRATYGKVSWECHYNFAYSITGRRRGNIVTFSCHLGNEFVSMSLHVSYDDDGELTVADLLANILDGALGDEGIGILQAGERVTTTYYTHVDGPCDKDCTVGNTTYDSTIEIKSLMWTIPFGQNFSFNLPELDFEIGNDALPLQLSVEDEGDPPVLEIEWAFTLAFGFDEDDGFFLYTYPDGLPGGEGCSELFIRASLLLDDLNINSRLLYFLNLTMDNVDIGKCTVQYCHRTTMLHLC